MLRFALPEYRLPKSMLKREIELIERMGVNVMAGHVTHPAVAEGVDMAFTPVEDLMSGPAPSLS